MRDIPIRVQNEEKMITSSNKPDPSKASNKELFNTLLVFLQKMTWIPLGYSMGINFTVYLHVLISYD
jgi:hypothetical protein